MIARNEESAENARPIGIALLHFDPLITYNPQQKRFERDGVPVTSEELRTLIDRLTLQTQREARRLSERLERGEITRDAWLVAMATLLRASHVVAASVGSGGYNRVTEERWRKVEKKVTWQGGFLPRFGAAIVAGTIIGTIAARASRYASAVYISFASAFQAVQTENSKENSSPKVRLITNSAEGCAECADDEAEGWMDLEDMKEIGDRICGDFCRCFLEFSDVE